jgi:hypothetical protein
VNALHDELWDALRNPDWDRIGEFFHQSPDLVSAMGGTVTYGFATTDSMARPIVDNWESQVLTVSESHTVVLSPDVVYTMRHGTDAVTLKSGETTATRPVIDTYVWVLRDGEWKILFGHSAAVNP